MFAHDCNRTIPDVLFKALRDRAQASVLVVGIGSPQAGDSIGWHMADLIGQQKLPGIVVRRALVPLDLLDWLEDFTVIHLIDALHSSLDVPIRCWQWPDCAELNSTRATSHDFDIVSVLQLVSVLEITKANIFIWGIAQ